VGGKHLLSIGPTFRDKNHGRVWQAVCSFNQINRVLLKNLVSFSDKLGLLGIATGNKLSLFERNLVF
jgi:hypothetical protein